MFMGNQTETRPMVVQTLILMAWADDQDHFENESSSGWIRMETAMEMNSMDTKATLAPQDYGLSYNDTFGCPDADGDGWSDEGDDLPFEPTQWLDGDGDGYGNNQSEEPNLTIYSLMMPLSGMILTEMDMETISTVQKEINPR